MAQIYSNAYITILASNSGDAAHGFLAHCIEYEAINTRIPFRMAPNRFGSITARDYAARLQSERSNNSLSTRAWALQERMMASRILAYTKHTLQWRCASSMNSLNNSLIADLSYDPMPKLISQLGTDSQEALSEWMQVVKDYSRRSISLPNDKLPAIAALAERFAEVLGIYHAGLWRYEFIKQLCWVRVNPPQRQRVGNPYRAPSWSWASVNEISLWYDDEEEDCCNLVSAVVLPKNAQVPYGEVVYASIKIRGKVSIASITRPAKDSYQMYTLLHHESVVAEPPLQRFYNTYFYPDSRSAALSRDSALKANFIWDYKEFCSDPLIVCKWSPTLKSFCKRL